MCELYWFNRLDTIRLVCMFIVLLGGGLNIMMIITTCISLEVTEKFKKFTLWLFILIVICALILMFLPSTQEAIALSKYE